VSPETAAFKGRVLDLLRETASHHRSVAADRKTNGHEDEARRWLKTAEALGNVANRIERGEADGEA
jgi:hypothetical protein